MAKTTSTQTKTRTRGPSKAELLIAILSANTNSERLSAIKALGPSKAVVRKAATEMRNNKTVCTALEHFASEQGYTIFRRGRYAPRVGETRVYNVQQVREDTTFIRLPLSSLEVDKGKKVRVDFEDGEIVVRACL